MQIVSGNLFNSINMAIAPLAASAGHRTH